MGFLWNFPLNQSIGSWNLKKYIARPIFEYVIHVFPWILSPFFVGCSPFYSVGHGLHQLIGTDCPQSMMAKWWHLFDISNFPSYTIYCIYIYIHTYISIYSKLPSDIIRHRTIIMPYPLVMTFTVRHVFLMALIEIDDFPSELNLHWWLGFSIAMLNNKMVYIYIHVYVICHTPYGSK